VAEAGAEACSRKEPEQAARRIVHEVAVAAAAQPRFTRTAKSGWWGAGKFASAGCLEGLEHTAQHVAAQRQEFTEGTQEQLYMSAQATKTGNKKGLGASAALRALLITPSLPCLHAGCIDSAQRA
jgi:hypothetical protein